MDPNLTEVTQITLQNDTMVSVKEFNDLKINLDEFFLVVMGAIILFMQAGFAFLEAGSVRSKNVISILTKNILDMSFGGLAYWICGYAFAFGEGSSVIGWTHFIGWDLPTESYAFMFFQGTFVATCVTIVSGAIAERADFYGYFVFSFFISGFVYPVHAHWCWGPNGWLGNNGYYDFAGSGVVHLAGGVCALVACWIIGPRYGRFKGGSTQPQDMDPHSFPLIVLGYFILVFGFLAFNGGSQAAISNPGDGAVVALIFFTTLIASCSGAVTVLVIIRIFTGYWKPVQAINGALTGMVSVCCGCDGFYPWSAALAGATGGIVYIMMAKFMIKIKIDDPLDAIAVHGGGGMLGLMIGPLLRSGGILSSSAVAGLEMLLWNAIGLGAIVAWNGLNCLVLFGMLKWLGILRVSKEAERVGLDHAKHGDMAYPEWSENVARSESSISTVHPMKNDAKNGEEAFQRVINIREVAIKK